MAEFRVIDKRQNSEYLKNKLPLTYWVDEQSLIALRHEGIRAEINYYGVIPRESLPVLGEDWTSQLQENCINTQFTNFIYINTKSEPARMDWYILEPIC